jgi:hypothetical protein
MIDDTLAAAGIPSERCGKERTARLNEQELKLYEQVLAAFASGSRPPVSWVRERASALGLDPDDAFGVLARDDLVHLGTDGEISVAYPFSGVPARHRVILGGETEAWAMCAIDALGMAAMLGKAVEVRSRDPVTEEPIEISLVPQGEQQWRPLETVVLAGRACDGPGYRSCCDVLNFFSSRRNAERYLAEHSDVQGHPITIPEAVAAGSAIFGEVLHAARS